MPDCPLHQVQVRCLVVQIGGEGVARGVDGDFALNPRTSAQLSEPWLDRPGGERRAGSQTRMGAGSTNQRSAWQLDRFLRTRSTANGLTTRIPRHRTIERSPAPECDCYQAKCILVWNSSAPELSDDALARTLANSVLR